MQTHWINKNNNKDLIVFLTGWSFDYKPFEFLDCNDFDVLFLYDYNSTDFQSNFEDYDKKYLITWSMGTYVGYLLKDVFDNLETNIKWDQAVAYIPFAIDLKMDELEMQQLPGTTQILNKLWFFKADKAKTEEIIDGYIQRLGLTDAEKKQFLKQKTNNDKKITMNTNNTTNTTKKNNTTTDNDDNRDLTKVNSSNTTNSNTVTKNKNTTNTTNTTKNNNTEKNNTKSNETTNTTKNDDENKEKENSSSENNKSNDSSNNGSTEVTKPSQNTGNDSSGESESGNGSKTEKDSGNNSSNENSSNTGNSNGGGEESSSSQSTSDP